MTGALRSTAWDVMEVHADLLPSDLLVETTCHRAAVRPCFLSNGNPLAAHARKAGKRTPLVTARTSRCIQTAPQLRTHRAYQVRSSPPTLEAPTQGPHSEGPPGSRGRGRKMVKTRGQPVYTDGSDFEGGRGGGRGAGEIRLAPRRKPCASWGASFRSVRTACVATSGRTSRPSQPHAGIRRARDRARQISRKLCRQDATPTSSDACIAASGESLCSFERATSPSQAT